jgi:hypothetical protein
MIYAISIYLRVLDVKSINRNQLPNRNSFPYSISIVTTNNILLFCDYKGILGFRNSVKIIYLNNIIIYTDVFIRA